MLEEKNDNLSGEHTETDGKLETVLQETQAAENEEITISSEANVIQTDATEIVEEVEAMEEETVNTISETEIEIEEIATENPVNAEEETPKADEIVVEEITATVEVEEAEVNEVPTPEEITADTSENTETVGTDHDIISAITDVNAAESEDETVRHDIPMLDYETMSMETLVAELENLVATDKVMAIKNHVEEIKNAFLAKYHHFIEEKKDEFHAENPESTEDFHYHLPIKTKFDQYYSQYRDRKNKHFKSLESNLKTNLENRMSIVEELKNLINPQENIKDTLKHFNDLRERWKNAGPIPKDKYNHVWNNYHFHVENFYDYLHLDREA